MRRVNTESCRSSVAVRSYGNPVIMRDSANSTASEHARRAPLRHAPPPAVAPGRLAGGRIVNGSDDGSPPRSSATLTSSTDTRERGCRPVKRVDDPDLVVPEVAGAHTGERVHFRLLDHEACFRDVLGDGADHRYAEAMSASVTRSNLVDLTRTLPRRPPRFRKTLPPASAAAIAAFSLLSKVRSSSGFGYPQCSDSAPTPPGALPEEEQHVPARFCPDEA